MLLFRSCLLLVIYVSSCCKVPVICKYSTKMLSRKETINNPRLFIWYIPRHACLLTRPSRYFRGQHIEIQQFNKYSLLVSSSYQEYVGWWMLIDLFAVGSYPENPLGRAGLHRKELLHTYLYFLHLLSCYYFILCHFFWVCWVFFAIKLITF